MRFSQRTIIAAAAAMAVVVWAGPAVAHVYNGNANMFVPATFNYSGAYPVTITGSQRSNGVGCLTLTGTGGSGQASLDFGGFKYPFGSFVVVDDILMATISEPLYGQNGALLFTVHTRRGNIGKGLFENVEGGSNFDFGNLAFGTKNGC